MGWYLLMEWRWLGGWVAGTLSEDALQCEGPLSMRKTPVAPLENVPWHGVIHKLCFFLIYTPHTLRSPWLSPGRGDDESVPLHACDECPVALGHQVGQVGGGATIQHHLIQRHVT